MTRLMAADGPCCPEFQRLQMTTDTVILFGLNKIVAKVNSLSVSKAIQKNALISVGEMSGRSIRKTTSRRFEPHTSAASSSSSPIAMMAELVTLVPKLRRWTIWTKIRSVRVPYSGTTLRRTNSESSKPLTAKTIDGTAWGRNARASRKYLTLVVDRRTTEE